MFLSFDASAGAATVTLPDANYPITGGTAVPANPTFVIKRADTSANTLKIVTTGDQTIDGSVPAPLPPLGTLRVISDASPPTSGKPSGGNWESW